VSRRTLLGGLLPLAAIGVALALVPAALGGGIHYSRITTVMLIYMTYTVAFNVIFGHTKQLFLCVGALAGSSAYLSIILVRELGVPAGLAAGLGTLFAAGLGGLLSYVAVRRSLGVIFVGVVTLAVSLIFQNLLLGLREYTNGETGIVTQGLGVGLAGRPALSYYVFLALLLLALGLYHLLLTSRAGVAFRALSDDELSAELAGIDVTRYKVLGAVVGSALLGLVGALFADYNGFISPSIFALGHVDIIVLIALLLGGMRTLLGPVIGGAIFTVIDEAVRPFGQITVLVYGVLLIVLFLAFRDGLVPLLRRVARLPIP
jgi:branched-chain amino acid transport system permease protein